MADSLGRVVEKTQDDAKKKLMEDTPEARAARIALYAQRANRCDIFAGVPRGTYEDDSDNDD